MKKTKIKQRINNAVNAFFENDQEIYNGNSLSFANNSSLLNQEAAERFNKKANTLVKILKQTFLFLPGALYLFFGTISFFMFQFIWINPLAIFAALLIGSFMTIFGIGNIKNPKHLVIPFSIIAVGLTAFSLFTVVGQSRYIFDYGIYFFPLALIVPFLAKSLVDKTDILKD